MPKEFKCPICEGNGRVAIEPPRCSNCGGYGYLGQYAQYPPIAEIMGGTCPQCGGTGKEGETIFRFCTACKGKGMLPNPTPSISSEPPNKIPFAIFYLIAFVVLILGMILAANTGNNVVFIIGDLLYVIAAVWGCGLAASEGRSGVAVFILFIPILGALFYLISPPSE